jgi:hypothetical protein
MVAALHDELLRLVEHPTEAEVREELHLVARKILDAMANDGVEPVGARK